MHQEIEVAIVNFLNQQANVAELELLENWLKDASHDEEFLLYVKTNYLLDVQTKDFDKNSLLNELSSRIQKHKVIQLQTTVRRFMKYASIVVLLIAAYLATQFFINSPTTNSESALNEVVLKSENGLITVLQQDGEFTLENREGIALGKKVNNTLVYQENKANQRLVYNTLTVPYGKQFTVLLSDGTSVQLNAGTSIRFPENFLEGQERKVFIEYGEAFFDVAKDENNPFIVHTNDMDIKVLGTQFNVSAYPEDEAVSTVLVEGAVQLMDTSQQPKQALLQPGYQAVWKPQQAAFEIREADIDLHTGWRTGRIVLKSLAFHQMITKLQRHYDVQIQCNDAQLMNEVITATFDEEDIEDVLQLINKIHPIHYTINGRTIQIESKSAL